MYSGYGVLSGVEIFNNNRVISYLQGSPLLGIPGLRHANTTVSNGCGCQSAMCLYCEQGSGVDNAYLSPELDNAPWWDPDVPDSGDFAGLFVEDITGFDSTVKRDFSDGAISGGALGPLRLSGRCMTVTGWLRAKTCCGAEYGLRWLTEALIGNNGCDDCAQGDLYMLKCCPPDDDTCYVSLSGTTTIDDAAAVTMSVTLVGVGVYDIFIDDPGQSGIISDPLGAANNITGAIPTCNTALNSSRFVFEDSAGALFPFMIPFDAITSFGTAASGGGASATIRVDTASTSTCEDMERLIGDLQDQIDTFLATYATGVPDTGTITVDAECYEVVSGINPQDYVRLLHRVGLTDGPKVIERMGTCCQSNCGCVNLKVQFTLCSELPYIFSDIEWCLEESAFDPLTATCVDLRDLCHTCTTSNSTKFVEREVRRPNCNISIRHDGTWCPESWPEDVEGCPPDDCLLTLGTIVEFTEDEIIDGGTGDACLIDLNDDRTWSAVNFNPVNGFVPEHCSLQIRNPNAGALGCDEQDVAGCVDNAGTGTGVTCEVTLVGTPGDSGTWTSADFDPAIDGFPPNCIIDVTNGGVCLGAVDEIQEIRVDATAGQFTLTFDGDTTANLNFNASANAMRLALEALTTIAPGDIDVTGGPGDAGATAPYVITFTGSLAATNVPAIVGNNVSLAGGGAAISVTTVTAGHPADAECGVKLVYNVDTGAQTWVGLWPAGTGAGCDCYTVTQFCIEGGQNCLVRIVYNEATGEQTWVPIRWNGDLDNADACTCFTIAEIQIITDPACVGTNDCPIDVSCETLYQPDSAATRQSVAAFFYRYNGSPPFTPPATPSFSDLALTNEFYLEIEWAYSIGLMEGYSDGTFGPEDAASRQAMAVFFYRDAGSPAFVPPVTPTFSDVDTTHAFYTEIEWAYSEGIFFGYSDGTFRPGDPVMRRVAALVFFRYAGSPPAYNPTLPQYFADVDPTDANFLQIEWMHDEGYAFGFVGSRVWTPIGWTHFPTEAFPPTDCNIYIETVQGVAPDTSPIRETIEVPWDEFVPDCGPFPIPPPAPAMITQECYCEPWESLRQCCTIRNVGDWNTSTTLIEVWTGSEEMRSLKIEAYMNPFGDQVPCPCDPTDEFWKCRDACATILVPQLPARSKLVIDSRTRIAHLILESGRAVNALRFIYAADGQPFGWFDIGQCSTFCLVASVSSFGVADDAWISIGSAQRFTASGW